MKKHLFTYLAGLFLMLSFTSVLAQDHTVARQWNEELLRAIRNDYARPTVHARNLYHSSIVMYDAWAIYEEDQETVFLGKTLGEYFCPYDGIELADGMSTDQAQEITLSYAMYRLMLHRFENAPGSSLIEFYMNQLMFSLELNPAITSVDYSTGSPIALGNYLAEQMINYGYTDGANEAGQYTNLYYESVNDTLFMSNPGNPFMTDPNRWQILALEQYIDQSGNPVNDVPEFLSPEWGNVVPFAMNPDDAEIYERDGHDYLVYHDPGMPPLLDPDTPSGLEDDYKWGNALVAVWGSHLDPYDGVLWDISPGGIGNIDIEDFPVDASGYADFYDFLQGGDIGEGYDINPVTGEPYEPQYVPRGDYGRILAEFWADGPDSETPPGHWFTILNYVNDHEMLEKKWRGKGAIIDDLEWDVKTYLTLGGAMHDCAIAAWGIKGWYDYVRPVSAIRYMAEKGQSTDPMQPNYDPAGFPLIEGYIELVDEFDPLAGEEGENVGEIKLYTWKGPDYIYNPLIDEAGVGWILAKNWWPYQRPTFVTPPFAGYVSGHSTYSRAAAEVMTLMTGDEYFPGGMGIFEAPMNEFLVFEEGPSMDIELQWATYRDASDQCSLSRIWGGIHPPADDIPGRKIGFEIGHEVFAFAEGIFDTQGPRVMEIALNETAVNRSLIGTNYEVHVMFNEAIDTMTTPTLAFISDDPTASSLTLVDEYWADCDEYIYVFEVLDSNEELMDIDFTITGTQDMIGNAQVDYLSEEAFVIDLKAPQLDDVSGSMAILADENTGSEAFMLTLTFDEAMDELTTPLVGFPSEDAMSAGLTLNEDASYWMDAMNFVVVYDLTDENTLLGDIDVEVSNFVDMYMNGNMPVVEMDEFGIDTENPMVNTTTQTDINDALVGVGNYSIEVEFNEAMNTEMNPMIAFPNEDPTSSLTYNEGMSDWGDDFTFNAVFDVIDENIEMEDIDLDVMGAVDANNNNQMDYMLVDAFSLDTKNPGALLMTANIYEVNQTDIGDGNFSLIVLFDEDMNTDVHPSFEFPDESPTILTVNAGMSDWINENTYQVYFDVDSAVEVLMDIDVVVTGAMDEAGNEQNDAGFDDFFDIVIETVTSVEDNNLELSDLALYPNPVQNGMEFIVEIGGQVDKLSWQLIDQNGRIVMAEEGIAIHNGQMNISTSNLPAGMYFVRLYTANEQNVLKVEVSK